MVLPAVTPRMVYFSMRSLWSMGGMLRVGLPRCVSTSEDPQKPREPPIHAAFANSAILWDILTGYWGNNCGFSGVLFSA